MVFVLERKLFDNKTGVYGRKYGFWESKVIEIIRNVFWSILKQFSQLHRSIGKVKVKLFCRRQIAATDSSSLNWKELKNLEKKSFIGNNSFQDSFLFEKFHSIISMLWCSAREIGKISAIFPWNCKQTRRIDRIIRWWFSLTTRYCHLHSIQSNIYN